MLILALESSAAAASAALTRDGRLVAEYKQVCGLTHSRTLLPMVESLLKNTETSLADVDTLAVSEGPGSFTGIRIGVSTVKGLCWGAQKPAIGVSTLDAMAWNALTAGDGALVCCCMDARRSQVYNSLNIILDGAPVWITHDRAIGLEELSGEVTERLGKPLEAQTKSGGAKTLVPDHVFLVGDGAELCYNYFSEQGIPCVLAPDNLRYQSAWGVCKAAESFIVPGEPVSPEAFDAAKLLPVYLRLSQAERERQARIGQEQDHN